MATEPILARRTGLRPAEMGFKELVANTLVGVPTTPVVTVPVLRVVGSHATYYESRTFTNGGLVVISNQRAPEAAVNRAIRPGADIIEVGEYPQGDWDLVNRIMSNDGTVVHNGRTVAVENKGRYIAGVAQKKGLTRMVTHEQHPSLIGLAQEWNLEYRENVGLFEDLGTKSGLNSALQRYKERHPGSPLGPFGVNFASTREIYVEIARLREYGLGAYIKLDRSETGSVAAGGEGHMAVPLSCSDEEVMRKVSELVGSGEDGKIAGVVQMMIADPKVFSVSSGEEQKGQGHAAYEAHIQTVDGSTADGAMPLDGSYESKVLLQDVWPEVKRFFGEEGVTGDANINCIALPPEYHRMAKRLYNNDNLAPVVFVDFNYRGISGTKNAMARYQEDTARPMDFSSFKSKGIKVDKLFAANPHLLYFMAATLGLRSGHGGNLAVINIGTFNPADFGSKDKFKTQVIVNGTSNPADDVARLEEVLSSPPSPRAMEEIDAAGFAYVDALRVAESDQSAYGDFIERSMKHYLALIQ